jgi:O-antigen ligase
MAAAILREDSSTAGVVLGLAGLVALGAAMGVAVAFGEADAALACLGITACLAVLYDFRFGAFLICAMLPLAESTLFPRGMFGINGLNPLNMVTLATLVSFLLHGRVRPRAGAIASPKLLWLYLLPLAVGALLGARHAGEVPAELYDTGVIHFTESGGYLLEIFAKPMLMVLAAVLVGAAVARSNKPERFFIPIGISIWLMAALSISYVARTSLTLEDLSSANARTFFSGTGLHANDLGRLYAVAYALMLFSWSESKNRIFRLACLASMGVVALALMFTFSRGAFLGFVVVNALFLLWRFNMKTAALVVLAGIVLFLLLPEAVFERASLGVGEDANAVSAGRIDGLWLPLVPELLKSPIWGNGLGSVMWSEPMRHGLMNVVEHPHNAYLESFLDIGALGLALVIGFYLHVWKGFRGLGSNPFISPEMRGFFRGAAARCWPSSSPEWPARASPPARSTRTCGSRSA